MSKTVSTTAVRCGFCMTGNHASCRPAVRRGDGGVWRCACTDQTHADQQPYCLECRSTEAVDPETWRCLDLSECQAAVASRMAKDPLLQFIAKCREDGQAEASERARARRIAANPDRPEPKPRQKREPKTPKPCRCGCGETTGGGKFRPGHDAKLKGRLSTITGDATLTAEERKAAADELTELGWTKYIRSV